MLMCLLHEKRVIKGKFFLGLLLFFFFLRPEGFQKGFRDVP